MTNKFKKLLSLSLIMIMILTGSGCNKTIEQNMTFDDFIKEEFKSNVSSDSLTLHYSLEKPETYGINEKTYTLGDFSEKSIEEDNDKLNKSYEQLLSYDITELSKSEKELYDVYRDYLETRINMKGDIDFTFLFSPIQGIHANQITTFTEFNINNQKDADKYLAILDLLPAFIDSALDFSQRQVDKHYFMNDSAIEESVKACDDFLSKVDDNVLIINFNSKIDKSNISDEQKNNLKISNKEIIINKIIPSYDKIKNKLISWKGTKIDQEHGLTALKGGNEYYKNLFKMNTGVYENIAEIEKELENALRVNIAEVIKISSIDKDAMNRYQNFKLENNDAKEIIKHLEQSTKENFEEIPNVEISVDAIDKTLENANILAYYMPSRIDNFTKNSIKYNSNAKGSDLDFYKILAHEGYPGHLYQTVYYYNQKANPLRYTLTYIGYAEGWAKYIEGEILNTIIINDENVINLCKANTNIGYYLSALVDMKIHNDGYSLKQVEEYMVDLGFNAENAYGTFNQSINDPGVILPYGLGLYEMNKISDNAISALGNKFDKKEFHKVVLNAGPSSFKNVQKHVDEYVKSKK